MTAKVEEEWRAVANSGRIVATFGERELAKGWRETHQQHSVVMVHVVTIAVSNTEHFDDLL